MRRFIGTTLIFGILGLPLTFLAGCAETTSSTVTSTLKTPSGSVTDKTTTEEKRTGDQKTNP
jgi:hypothetical protein